MSEPFPDNAHFRYRTAVLVGPWRDRREEAEADAVRAKQAGFGEARELVWTVEGEIEEHCLAMT